MTTFMIICMGLLAALALTVNNSRSAWLTGKAARRELDRED